MNREIKFRAWDADRKEMIYRFKNNRSQTPALLQNDNAGEFNFFCGSYQKNGDWQEPELMQYTGLKDSKGVEIYESDKIKLKDGNVGVVKFNNQYCGFWIEFQIQPFREQRYYNFNVTYSDGNITKDETIEVIGNAFQHPHPRSGK